MANKEKGEISFTMDGVDYLLVFNFNVFCELEDLFEMPIHEILQIFLSDGKNFGYRELRKFYLAGLRTNHPDMSADECGALIESVGVSVAQADVLRGITAAFQDTKEKQKKKVKSKPGTGGNS